MPKLPEVDNTNIATVQVEREVLYSEVNATVYSGDSPMTEAEAMTCLGWTEPTAEQGKFKEFNLFDIHNRTIVCTNLNMQRPFYRQVAADLMYDILHGYWQLNLESIIIGETGTVVDGKHRLAALVLACQEYRRNPEMYPCWDKDPTIEVLVAFGAKETKEVINSIGTGKPRSLADSLFASGVLSPDLDAKARRQHSKVTEFCIRMLWHRTGAVQNAYSPRIRHPEAIDFLDRHATIHQCVRTIIEENGGKHRRLDKMVSLGMAAGLLYMMGATTDDDGDLYRKQDQPIEEMIAFSNMEQAEKYWLNLSTGDATVKAVQTAIAKLVELGSNNVEEHVGIIIKGWIAFQEKGSVTAKDLHLKVTTDDNGYRSLVEVPVVPGSIDHPCE